MLAFEVSVSGRRCYVAGHREAQMLMLWVNANLSRRAERPPSVGISTSVSVPAATGKHPAMLSYPYQQISVGDEVTIRVLEVDTADQPTPGSTGKGSIEIESGDR